MEHYALLMECIMEALKWDDYIKCLHQKSIAKGSLIRVKERHQIRILHEYLNSIFLANSPYSLLHMRPSVNVSSSETPLEDSRFIALNSGGKKKVNETVFLRWRVKRAQWLRQCSPLCWASFLFYRLPLYWSASSESTTQENSELIAYTPARWLSSQVNMNLSFRVSSQNATCEDQDKRRNIVESSSAPLIAHMWEQEKEHLDEMERQCARNDVAPSLLAPIFTVAGYTLGWRDGRGYCKTDLNLVQLYPNWVEIQRVGRFKIHQRLKDFCKLKCLFSPLLTFSLFFSWFSTLCLSLSISLYFFVP